MCEGDGDKCENLVTKVEKKRKKYRPELIKTLLVGEFVQNIRDQGAGLKLFLFVFPLCLIASTTWAAGWSREATYIPPYNNQGTRHFELGSPDGQKKVIVDGIDVRIILKGKLLSLDGVNTLAEILWSPDSKAFFITESDGGAVGTWGSSVYILKDDKIQRVDPTRNALKAFQKIYRCIDDEKPENIGAVTWLKNSSQLLLVANVQPHSTCPDMGKIAGYVVDVPTGKIRQEIREKEFRAKWGKYLGEWFSPQTAGGLR